MDLRCLKCDPMLIEKHSYFILSCGYRLRVPNQFWQRSFVMYSCDVTVIFFSPELQWCQSHLKGKPTRQKSGTAHSTNRRPSVTRQLRWITAVTVIHSNDMQHISSPFFLLCDEMHRLLTVLLCFRNGPVQMWTASSSYPWKMSSSRPTLRSTLLRKTLHQSPLQSRQVFLLCSSIIKVFSLFIYQLHWTIPPCILSKTSVMLSYKVLWLRHKAFSTLVTIVLRSEALCR